MPLAADLERGLALQFVAPVVAVLRLDPRAAPALDVAARAALGDDALELVLADRLPERLAVLERLRRPPLRSRDGFGRAAVPRWTRSRGTRPT
jgi:hypothetical protein